MWPFSNSTKDKPKVKTKSVASMRSVSKTHADMTMRGSEAIYAAVSRIANTVASMPLHLYKGWEIQTEHPLERLVGLRPNDNFSSFTFLQTMEACRNTEGNAYALIRRDALGAPMRLDILDPTKVRPQWDSLTREMYYAVNLEAEKPYILPGCEIIAVKHMSANGEMGIRPLDVLYGTLSYDASVKDFSLNQMDGINQGMFLNVPATGLSADAKERVIDSFIDAYEKSGQRIVILEGGLTATPFSQSPVNAQVLDVERITRNRVATVYNIPPHLLGDYSDTSFATAEQQMMEFLNLCIMPIVAQWEQELNRKLLTEADYRAGYRFRFDVASLNRADRGTMSNIYQQAIRGGWMTPNEVREREGLVPMDDGAQLMASRDLIPLSISVNTPEMLLGITKTAGGDE